MLKKSCQWWLICYLLFFCHGGAEGQLQWVVKEKVTAYGQNLILLCPIENCCSEPAGWSVGPKSIIIDVKTFSNDPKVKYHGTYNTDGFGVVIRNLSEADLNVTYRCVYGLDQSTPKYLIHRDVFRENVPDKDKDIDTAAIVVAIVVIMVGFIIGMTCSVYRSRTDEEMEVLYHSDIQMEYQQDPQEMHAMLGRITVTVLPKMCQQILESIIPAGNLYCSFQNRKDLKILLVEDELAIITTMRSNGYKHFTVQLCYKILRHEQWVDTPRQNWGNVPLHTDVHIADDIERIRLSRNKIVSMETKSLDKATFLTLIDEFREIAKRVDVYLKKDGMFLLQIQPTESMTTAEIESTIEEIRRLPVIKDNPFSVHTITQGMTNYSRLGLVVVDIFPNILREIMRSKIAPEDLNRHIRKQQKHNPSFFNKMSHEERVSLNTLTKKTYDNIDFITLYKLIRSFPLLDDPTQGWGKPPMNADVTSSDDVERLRIARNQIVHRIKADIDLIEMNDYFSNIVNITQRIDTYLCKLPDQGLAREVLNFQTHCMDSEMEQKYYLALKNIEEITEKFSVGNMHFYYGKTFSNFIQEVQDKANSSVRKTISLVLEDINDDEKQMILNQLKTEINSGLVNIEFKYAASGSLIIYIDILDSNLLSTEQELCHQIFIFLSRALQLTGFNMKTENEITVVLIKEEDDIEVEFLIESDNWETYDEEISLRSNTLCLELEVNTEIFNTVQKMQSEFGLLVKSVLGSNGKSNVESVSARLEPGIVERPSIHITSTNTDVVEGQSHTITCSISRISVITDITWNKTSATGDKIAIVVGEDGKFSGGTLSDPSLTINNIAKSDEGTYACIAKHSFGTTSSEDSVLTCKELKTIQRMEALNEKLCNAAEDGNKDLVHYYLQEGADVNYIDFGGRTPLHKAAEMDRTEEEDFLLKSGASPSVVNDQGHNFIRRNILEHITPNRYYQSTSGASPSVVDNEGRTLLKKAGLSNRRETVEILLKSGASPSAVDNEGQTPLHRAALRNRIEMLELLLKLGASPSEVDNEGRTPLHRAAEWDRTVVVDRLLKSGASTYVVDNKGRTPLHRAAKWGSLDVLNLLLKSGASPSVVDNQGQTPLHQAALRNSKDALDLLLKSGSPPSAVDKRGRTPLHTAALRDGKEVVDLLLKSGASPSVVDKQGRTPLHRAAKSDRTEVADILLKSGASPSVVDKQGKTPLYIAAEGGRTKVVDLLLKSGASPSVVDNQGQTPLYIAAEGGRTKVVDLLLKSGASPSVVDNQGKTPYDVAHYSVKELLQDLQ